MVITNLDDMTLDVNAFTAKKPKDYQTDPDSLKDFEKLLNLHGGATHVETKYDGNGIVIDTRTSSPQLRSLSGQVWDASAVPELESAIHALPSGLYVGEIVGRPTKPGFTGREEFQAAQSRGPFNANKKLSQALVDKFPLDIRLYDMIFQNGQVIANQSFEDRKARLEDLCAANGQILSVAYQTITDPTVLQKLTMDQFDRGLEGFIVKKPGSPYALKAAKSGLVGVRNNDWVKIKEALTVDLVVLGLRQKEGRQNQGCPCSNVLAGTYNDKTNQFETLSIVNIPSVALAKQFYDAVAPLCALSYTEAAPHTWQNKGVAPNKSVHVTYSSQLQRGAPHGKVPFMYVLDPRAAPVIEVRAKSITGPRSTWHSCGAQETNPQAHSLQQPKYLNMRPDKTALMATTTSQVRDMYNGV